MSAKNTCPICGGSKVKGTTTFTVDLGFGVVVVRNVPASFVNNAARTGLPTILPNALR